MNEATIGVPALGARCRPAMEGEDEPAGDARCRCYGPAGDKAGSAGLPLFRPFRSISRTHARGGESGPQPQPKWFAMLRYLSAHAGPLVHPSMASSN